MAQFKDQLDRLVNIPNAPKRIISLVPSQTELLYRLSLEEEVKGITKFCTQPEAWFRSKVKVGGTKNIDLAKIRALNPDLIIAAREENIREQVEELAQQFPVWASDVSTYEQALEMIKAVGAITGRAAAAAELLRDIEIQFGSLQVRPNAGVKSPTRFTRIAYLIWKDPYMAAGGDTFIGDMLRIAHFENVFEDRARYPSVSIEELVEAACDVLFLSSEPYPFTQKHLAALSEQLPGTRVMLVDGMPFSWYGSRLVEAPSYFLELHREISLNN